MGFCLFKGDFGKIGQPHPYTTARLIFLVRQANLDKWSDGSRTWNPEVLTKTN